MKITINSRNRIYATVLCFIFLFLGGVLLLHSTLSIRTLEGMMDSPDTLPPDADERLVLLISGNRQFSVIAAIISATGFILSLIILVSTYRSRIGKYMRVIERIDLLKPGAVNVASITFPDEDEFGNLGKRLNTLISVLTQFDALKTEKIQVLNGTIAKLAERIPQAFAILDSDLKVVYSNEIFGKVFDINISEGQSIKSFFQSEDFFALHNTAIEEMSAVSSKSIVITAGKQNYKCSLAMIVSGKESQTKLANVICIFESVKKS